MPDLNCKTCGGLGWVETRSAGCDDCNPKLDNPKRKPMKRSRIKQRSEKRKEQDKTHVPLRKALKAAIGYCDVCGRKRKAADMEEHHIGRQRHKETMNPRRCLYVCKSYLRDCHDKADGMEPEDQVQLAAAAMLRALERCKAL